VPYRSVYNYDQAQRRRYTKTINPTFACFPMVADRRAAISHTNTRHLTFGNIGLIGLYFVRFRRSAARLYLLSLRCTAFSDLSADVMLRFAYSACLVLPCLAVPGAIGCTPTLTTTTNRCQRTHGVRLYRGSPSTARERPESILYATRRFAY